MDITELQELLATQEGQAKLHALFWARGKDVLRQMAVDMSTIIVNQQKEIEDLKNEIIERDEELENRPV